VDKERINESSSAILEEMRKLAEEKISPAELNKARESLSGRLVLRLETSDDMAGFYGGEELLTEKIIEPEEELKKIQAVTAEEVMSLSAYLFRKEKLNMAFLGTNAEEEKLRKILEAGLPA
jgi:predicted Zn-dependent peptidase